MPKDKLLSHTIEVKAMQVEKMLSLRGIEAEITGGTATKDLISFTLNPRIASVFGRLQTLSSEIAKALRVPQVHLSKDGDNFSITFKQRQRKDIELPVLLNVISELRPLTAIIGKGDNEHYLHLSLENTSVSNVLIATQDIDESRHLMRSMAISFAMSSKQSLCQMLIINSIMKDAIDHSVSLFPLNYLPHLLLPLPEYDEEIKELLLFLKDEIAYRRKNSLIKPAIIAFIDRLDRINPDNDPDVQEALSIVLQHGHEAGLVTVLSVENIPDRSILPLMSHNIDLRLVGNFDDPNTLKYLMGTELSDGNLRLDKHRMIAISGTDFIEFKPAKIDDYDLHYYIDQIYRSSDPVLLAQAEDLGRGEYDEDNVSNQDESEIRFNMEQGMMIVEDTESS
jgi:hypothetical protein